MKKPKTTNPELIELIRFLRRQSREHKVNIWRDLAIRLAKPRRNQVSVNLSRLSRYSEKNETVVVPGKVLGTGELDHPMIVAAIAFSKKAKRKMDLANAKCMSLIDLVKKNPKGSNIRIIG